MQISKIFQKILILMLLSSSWCYSTGHTKKNPNDINTTNNLGNIETNDLTSISSEQPGKPIPKQTKQNPKDINTANSPGDNESASIHSEQLANPMPNHTQENPKDINTNKNLDDNGSPRIPSEQLRKPMPNQTKKDLKDLITIQSLDRIEFDIQHPMPLISKVKNILKTKCPDLNVEMIKISIDNDKNTVEISPMGQYRDHFNPPAYIILPFELNRLELEDIIKITSLGEIECTDNYGIVLKKEEFENILKTKCPDLNFEVINFFVDYYKDIVSITINKKYYDYFIHSGASLDLPFKVNYKPTIDQKNAIQAYKKNKKQECSKCSELLEDKKSGVLPCGHYLHYKCIKMCEGYSYEQRRVALQCYKCKNHIREQSIVQLDALKNSTAKTD